MGHAGHKYVEKGRFYFVIKLSKCVGIHIYHNLFLQASAHTFPMAQKYWLSIYVCNDHLCSRALQHSLILPHSFLSGIDKRVYCSTGKGCYNRDP